MGCHDVVVAFHAVMRYLRPYTLYILCAIALAAIVWVLFNYNPETAGFYPRCPSKVLTGYNCPGCGSLRGLHALLHGNIAAAWHYNAALPVALGLLATLGLAGIHRRAWAASRVGEPARRMSRKVAAVTDHPAFPVAILAATTAWTILRNL